MGDLQFVQRCVKRDSLAWDEFLQKYSRLIYNYIHSVLRVKGVSSDHQQHIQDIFQGIFSALIENNYKKLRSFRGKNGCSLASWLRQVTINFTLDYLRRVKTGLSLDEEDAEGFSLQEVIPDSSGSIPEKLNQIERLDTLKECVKKLERNDKYFLELHLYRKVPLEKLKGHLRISRGAVDMRKSRIFARLKECFKKKGFQLDL